MKRVYLDHAATTPVREEVLEEILPFYKTKYGNPSSIYKEGREAKKAIEKSRERVAEAIGAENPEEIYFTGSGTEADNWAIIGTAFANKDKGNHIITSQIEHHAVLHTCEYLEKNGFEVTYLPVDNNGLIDIEQLKKSIKKETILVTIMHANNEIGTIQPIKEVGEFLKDKDIYYHTDAVQTVGKIPVNVQDLNVDMLSLSGHKIYAPKGIGALYIKRGTKIESIIHGGAQERKRRAGTENVAGIVALGKAIELSVNELDHYNTEIKRLRDKLIKGIKENISDVRLNGHPTKRLPHNVNVSIEYIEGESLLLNLDMKGISASSGSACTSGSLDPSHVLLSIGLSHEVAHGSLRLTLGKDNKEEDVDYVIKVLPKIVSKLRDMSPLFNQNKEETGNV